MNQFPTSPRSIFFTSYSPCSPLLIFKLLCQLALQPLGRDTNYSGLYGKASPEKFTVFRLGILGVEFSGREGENAILAFTRAFHNREIKHDVYFSREPQKL